MTTRILHGDCLELMADEPDGAYTLVYADPPFNTGRSRSGPTSRRVAAGGDEPDAGATNTGFGGRAYRRERASAPAARYADAFDDYLGFLMPRVEQMRRLLTPDGTLYLHLDQREVHYVKVACDELFGRDCFVNEIVWAYDYGARPTRRWPAKHDTILVYARTPGGHHFDAAEVEREPYMAPGLVTPEKRARGKLPTDVMWHTIVSPTGREKTGYPTQKPEGLIRRFVAASTRPGDRCLDPFAGSGTLGAVCASLGRECALIDQSADAVAVQRARLTA